MKQALSNNLKDLRGYVADYKCVLSGHANCDSVEFSETPTLLAKLVDPVYKWVIRKVDR